MTLLERRIKLTNNVMQCLRPSVPFVEPGEKDPIAAEMLEIEHGTRVACIENGLTCAQ